MLPGNVASSLDVPGAFLPPDTLASSKVIDFERGGVAIGDASLGLDYQDWRGEVIEATGQVRIYPVGSPPSVYYTESGITEFSFCFDQSMRPVLAYVASGLTKLRWFDSVAGAFTVTTFPNTRSPRLALDDKRPMQIADSDVIFGYIRSDGALCYRQQRDRYEIERVLRVGIDASQRLINMGMSNVLRLQFEIG